MLSRFHRLALTTTTTATKRFSATTTRLFTMPSSRSAAIRVVVVKPDTNAMASLAEDTKTKATTTRSKLKALDNAHEDEEMMSSGLSDAPSAELDVPKKTRKKATATKPRTVKKIPPTALDTPIAPSKPKRKRSTKDDAYDVAGSGSAEAVIDTAVEAPPKPKRKRTIKKATPEPDPIPTADTNVEDMTPPKPKRKRSSKKTEAEVIATEPLPTTLPDTSKPKRKRATKKTEPTSDVDNDNDDGVETNKPKPKPKRSRSTKKVVDDEEFGDGVAAAEGEEGGEDAPKPKRKRKPKEPVVYDIPDVARKETTFKGTQHPLSNFRNMHATY